MLFNFRCKWYMALIKVDILKIFWTSYLHNGMYVLRTKHICSMLLFVSGCWKDTKRAGHAYTRFCGVVFFNVFRVRESSGKKIIFKVWQKSVKIFDNVSVRNNSANSIYVALKILEIKRVWKWRLEYWWSAKKPR